MAVTRSLPMTTANARSLLGPMWLAANVALLVAGPVQAQTVAPAATPPAAARSAIERQEIRAQLLPRRYTTIAAEIGAKINRLPVAEGGAFRAGQMLVSFDCSLQQAQLQKAHAELDGAQQTDKTNQQLAELNSVGQL